VADGKLLTTKQAAERLQVSMGTLRNWRRAGKGPACSRLGPATYRYDEQEVDRFINQQTLTAMSRQT